MLSTSFCLLVVGYEFCVQIDPRPKNPRQRGLKSASVRPAVTCPCSLVQHEENPFNHEKATPLGSSLSPAFTTPS